MRPVKEPVVGGIIWMLGLAAPGDVFGRGEEADATSRQSSGGEGRVLQGRASAQGQVETLSHEIDVGVGQPDVQADLRVAASKLHEQLRQYGNAKVVRRSDPEFTGRLDRALGKFEHCSIERSHVWRRALVEGHARGRESYRVRGPVKQFRAQLALEFGNRAA